MKLVIDISEEYYKTIKETKKEVVPIGWVSIQDGIKYEERPHGKWVWKEYNPDYNCGDIVCSKCNIVICEGVPQERLKYIMWNFCPNCGADMRKEGEAE